MRLKLDKIGKFGLLGDGFRADAFEADLFFPYPSHDPRVEGEERDAEEKEDRMVGSDGDPLALAVTRVFKLVIMVAMESLAETPAGKTILKTCENPLYDRSEAVDQFRDQKNSIFSIISLTELHYCFQELQIL